MIKKKGIIERAMENEASQVDLDQEVEKAKEKFPNVAMPSPEAPSYTYFVHYTCEAMGKQLAMSKVFNFQTPICGSTFDSVRQAIAQHEKVAEVTITNFIEVLA